MSGPGHPLILYITGLLPKPEPDIHRDALLRCILAGVRRIDGPVEKAIEADPGAFDVVSWTFDFYGEYRDFDIDRDAVITGLGRGVDLTGHLPAEGVEPYPPLELAGRDIYVREGCYNCHSQMVRPFRSETERYGPYSVAGESVYDRPFQWGSKRTGPDLARVGGRYSNDWHIIHLINPRDVVPASNMPGYPWLAENTVDGELIEKKMKVLAEAEKLFLAVADMHVPEWEMAAAARSGVRQPRRPVSVSRGSPRRQANRSTASSGGHPFRLFSQSVHGRECPHGDRSSLLAFFVHPPTR